MSEKKPKKSMKGYYLTTFLIGLGFFTMGLMDPLTIPISQFLESLQNRIECPNWGQYDVKITSLLIFLIPIFSAIVTGPKQDWAADALYCDLLPLSGLAFAHPFAALSSLALLIILIFVFNLFKQSVRGPVVALMPDMVPGEIRSEANGVINTMGGIAAIVGTIGLAQLMNVKLNLSKYGPTDNILAYPFASVLVIIAVILLFFFVKEKKGLSRKVCRREKYPS